MHISIRSLAAAALAIATSAGALTTAGSASGGTSQDAVRATHPRTESPTAGPPEGVRWFNTSESRFRTGFDNQGTAEISACCEPAWNRGDDYSIGFYFSCEYPFITRNYFTFDLSDLAPGSVTSARLVLRRYDTFIGGKYKLHKVSSDAEALNTRQVDPADAFRDFGDGPVYGRKRVEEGVRATRPVRVRLNAAGVSAVNAAAGGFFSLGGDLGFLDGTDTCETNALFRNSSGAGVQRLVVKIAPGSSSRQ